MRCFIVVDDIWKVEIWEVIKLAFPRIGCGSIIITTTRLNVVAQACSSLFNGHTYSMKPLSMVHSRQLFHRRLFNSEECPSHLEEVSGQILKKCAGLPLAIISISGLLANKAKTKDQWRQVETSIGRALERNPCIEGMIKIISLSYFDLPHHLKTCLLSLSIFPEDTIIYMDLLIRIWIAEGFIPSKDGYTLYEAGEMCFNELVNRSLIKLAIDEKEDYYDGIEQCRVHDIILDFIISKAIEENFVTIIGVPGVHYDPQNKVRRLSLQNNGKIPVGLVLSNARSLNVFGADVEIPSLSEFKHLRVLCFEGCGQLEDRHLADIDNLLHLECLCLSNADTVKALGDVQFGRIKALQLVDSIVINNQPINFVRRIGGLTNLWKLALHIFNYETAAELACSIRKLLKANLRSLHICLDGSSGIDEEENFLKMLNLPAQCSLKEFSMSGSSISTVPRWMGSLFNLQKLELCLIDVTQEDVKILGGLLDLRYIEILFCNPLADHIRAAMESLVAAHPNHPELVWVDASTW